MAKKEKPRNERLFRTERLNIALTKFEPKAGKRSDKTYAYRDTLLAEAVLYEDDLVDLLEDMGVENPAFIRERTPEVQSWALQGCHYYDHHLQLKVSGKKVAEMEDAEIYNLLIQQAGNDGYKVSFSFTGVPTSDEHRNFELAYLDAKSGKRHHLVIAPPAQQELEQHNEEAEEPA